MNTDTITLQQLKEMKSYKDLYDISKKIVLQDQDLLESFLVQRIEKYGYDGMYAYFLHPMFSKVTSNFRFRYVIVDLGDDKVLIPFKYVFVMTTRYIRLYGVPISLNDNTDNVITVLKTLVDNKIVKQVQYIAQEEKLLKESGLDVQTSLFDVIDDDYYSVVLERWNKIDKARWRNKYSINVINKMENVQFRKLETKDLPQAYEVSKQWETTKSKKDLTNKRMLPNTLKQLEIDIDNKSLMGYGLFYKDIILGVTIFYVSFNGDYVHHAILRNLAKVDEGYIDEIIKDFNQEERDEVLKAIKNIGRYMFYCSVQAMKERKVKAIYMAGATNKKNLKQNKICLNDYCIQYFGYKVY